MSHDNPRIKSFNMTGKDVVIALSEGNPGALRVLCDLMVVGPTIDPDSALGEWGPAIHLDGMDIYGSRIWRLYKDVCGQDYYRMVGLLRANQLGFVSQREIDEAIDVEPMRPTYIDLLLAQVKDKLPRFLIADPAKQTEAKNDA